MSEIFLNYDDVRHLVKTLGKYRPEDNALSRVQLVSAGLRTNVGLFHNRLHSGEAPSGVGINLTLDHYQRLCEALRNSDLTEMRNTDRLEVVAGALGWRADALMHHLKTVTGEMGANPSLRYDIDFVAEFVKLVGHDHSERWRSMVNAGPGLFVVAGQPGSRVSHSWIATVMFLDPGAKARDDYMIVGRRSADGHRVYGVPARDLESFRKCVELASTSTVIATCGGASFDEARTRLAKWADTAGITLSCLKGMIHKTIRHRYSGQSVEIDIDIRDFTDR